jgi:hypothetical protein
VHRIFEEFRYGLRKDGADVKFQVIYPGVRDPFQYWDMRLPEDDTHQDSMCSVNEVCFELFFFGEFKMIRDHEAFKALVARVLELNGGIKARLPLPIREAGCMYPLIAVPIVITELEGMELGAMLFDDFGTALPASKVSEKGSVAAGSSKGCGQQ